ncbi:MAG TPA: UDP-N-acetylmuramate dehydrogenase [Chromatiales bacterium]|nr:UDP-N-acetylmuramate dehydrogenase [Chromatiales bacterium]
MGELRCNESMSRHTSWRVGGTAKRFFKPDTVEELATFLAQLPPEEPIVWVGLGSNLLVRDGGIDGAVICTSGVLGKLALLESDLIRAEAGVPCAKLARFSVRFGLAGGEFLIGIPGTVGGALAMNAGAFGGETWPIVEMVETIDRQGRRYLRTPEEYQIGYRTVTGPEDEWFLAAHFRLRIAREDGLARTRALLEKRNETQPTGQASCGSVFRNPEGDHAGRLIEACGLKGYSMGGAVVSEKHANFIINSGTATAADIEGLIQLVMRRVEEEQGVKLVPEVHIVGDAAPIGEK